MFSNINEGFFEEVGPKQAYFLGLMASDGYINPNGRYFSLGQSGVHGHKLVKDVAEMLEYALAPSTQKTAGADTHVIHMISEVGVGFLSKYGVIPRKSLVLEWPWALSENLIPCFLRGYLDGDGCVGEYNHGSTVIATASFVGTRDFITAARSHIPFPASGQYKIKAAKNCHELCFYGKKARVVLPWLYTDTPDSLPKSAKYYKALAIGKKVYEYDGKIARKKEFQQMVLSGATIKMRDLAAEWGVAVQTLYKWRNQCSS